MLGTFSDNPKKIKWLIISIIAISILMSCIFYLYIFLERDIIGYDIVLPLVIVLFIIIGIFSFIVRFIRYIPIGQEKESDRVDRLFEEELKKYKK